MFVIRQLTLARNGHGCMLQYALLHLFGFELSMEDIKNFRVRTAAFPD